MHALLVLSLPAMLAAGRLHLHLRATDRQLQQLHAARATDVRRATDARRTVRTSSSNVVQRPAVRLSGKAA